MNDLICIKKRKSSIQDYNYQVNEFNHVGKKVPLNIPHQLSDEVSFIKWFNYLRVTIPLTRFHNLINLSYINTSDENYCHNLKKFNSKCFKYKVLNNELNDDLFNSISPGLIEQMELDKGNLAYCNFEKIKVYFQCKINVFYLMNLEDTISFSHDNKLKFLNDLDHLCNVYQLIFNELPSKDLKINWIVNSINRDKILSDNEILIDIQNNWESICKDPVNLRKLLLKY